jgi:hypothetical protein
MVRAVEPDSVGSALILEVQAVRKTPERPSGLPSLRHPPHLPACPNVPIPMDHGNGTARGCWSRQCPRGAKGGTRERSGCRHPCPPLWSALWTAMFVPGAKIPCPWASIPSPSQKPPSGSAWVHEIKHDGYRLIARRDGKRVRLYTRRGYDWSDR